MLNETPLIRFIALITFDRDYDAMNRHIAALENEIVLLQQNKQELVHTHAAAEQVMQTQKKEIDAYERAIKALEERIKEKKERLATAMSPREHRAVMAEINSLSVEQLNVEEQLLTAWTSFDTRKRLYDKLVQSDEQRVDQINDAIDEKQQQIKTEKIVLVEREQQRLAYEQGVPDQWLEKYAAMRSRVANPVVPIEQGACSACFYSLSEHDLGQLRRRALLPCKGCYRFLYCPTAHHII